MCGACRCLKEWLMASRRLVPTVIALLSLAHAAGPRTALADYTAPGPGTARIQVTATVLPRASITVLHQEMFLNVTTEDVSRGYVTYGRLRVEVGRTAWGYLLVFAECSVPNLS
jgi:hypothetical protein